MQSVASIGHAVYRITLKRGSPQRLQYSGRLTVGALIALLGLAFASQVYAFHADLVMASVYLFTLAAGLYLGSALMSRRTPPSRLRLCLQATLVLWAAAHGLILLCAPLRNALPWAPFAVASAASVLVILGMSNCVQFALGGQRVVAVSYTLGFAFALAAFYATMQILLGIAMG